jgi:redox-sensitive bicupin YhaK (pirin superfamily)
VGDGFPVNNMLSYGRDHNISPFLLLDYAEPMDFSPSDVPKGVGQHPHRGFETVTIVYDGEVQHTDTAGNAGKIGAGDVQWMTAASGILHEERHSDDFTRKGGRLEMVQLWVNLPAKNKMSKPHYQEILNSNIPTVLLPNNAGSVRVIAGSFADIQSTVKTFTPINIYDIRVSEGKSVNIPVINGFNAILLVLSGKISIGKELLNASELAIFSEEGEIVALNAKSDTKILFMSGEPIDEPIIGKGPFVMNTQEEINQAFSDLRTGKLQ